MPKRTMKCYRYAEKCVDENTLGENITNEWCLDIRLKSNSVLNVFCGRKV